MLKLKPRVSSKFFALRFGNQYQQQLTTASTSTSTSTS